MLTWNAVFEKRKIFFAKLVEDGRVDLLRNKKIPENEIQLFKLVEEFGK